MSKLDRQIDAKRPFSFCIGCTHEDLRLEDEIISYDNKIEHVYKVRCINKDICEHVRHMICDDIGDDVENGK